MVATASKKCPHLAWPGMATGGEPACAPHGRRCRSPWCCRSPLTPQCPLHALIGPCLLRDDRQVPGVRRSAAGQFHHVGEQRRQRIDLLPDRGREVGPAGHQEPSRGSRSTSGQPEPCARTRADQEAGTPRRRSCWRPPAAAATRSAPPEHSRDPPAPADGARPPASTQLRRAGRRWGHRGDPQIAGSLACLAGPGGDGDRGRLLSGVANMHRQPIE
jgi:hypothetical protein